jgi:hypothetical protein
VPPLRNSLDREWQRLFPMGSVTMYLGLQNPEYTKPLQFLETGSTMPCVADIALAPEESSYRAV